MKDGRFESAREMLIHLGEKGVISYLDGSICQKRVLRYDGKIIAPQDGLPCELLIDRFSDYGPYQEPKKLKKVKLLGWINTFDGNTITLFDGKSPASNWHRCPTLDKEVEYEE